jgi:hypothetical protein
VFEEALELMEEGKKEEEMFVVEELEMKVVEEEKEEI